MYVTSVTWFHVMTISVLLFFRSMIINVLFWFNLYAALCACLVEHTVRLRWAPRLRLVGCTYKSDHYKPPQWYFNAWRVKGGDVRRRRCSPQGVLWGGVVTLRGFCEEEEVSPPGGSMGRGCPPGGSVRRRRCRSTGCSVRGRRRVAPGGFCEE